MSIIDAIVNLFEKSVVAPVEERDVAASGDWLTKARSIYGYDTATGVQVTTTTAITSTGVLACVKVLAETVASLPLMVYERTADGGKQRAVNHALYTILHDIPNPEMTSFELRETLMGHLCLWGNAYCEIQYDRRGQVIALWPLRPDRVEVRRMDDKQLWYFLTLPESVGAGGKALPSDRVLHIKGLSSEGLVGLSPISQARQAIGLALATEEFGARFFGNGARPGVVLQHPGQLGDEAYKRLRDSFEERHGGLENSHRVAILEEGMQVKEVGIPPEDAQFLQTRVFQLEEIARIYRVPAHLVGNLSKATFSNIEHQALEFVVHTIRPWLVRWEQGMDRSLLTTSERTKYFIEFLVDGLLRGDIMSRYQAYAVGRQNGWLSANDVRTIENMNPVDGGDVYLIPLNMVPAGTVTSGSAGGQPETPPDAAASRCGGWEHEYTDPPPVETRDKVRANRRRLMKTYERIYRDVAARIIKRETNDIRNQARKTLGKRSQAMFDTWLGEFYADHDGFIQRQLTPVAMAYGELVAHAVEEETGKESTLEQVAKFIAAYVAGYAGRHTGKSRSKLRKRIEKAQAEGEDVLESVEAELDEWNEQRPGQIAMDESVRANNAVAKALYIGAGYTTLRWYTSGGKSCPYCQEMDGRVVGTDSWFMPAGESFKPDGADSGMAIGENIGHPPLHDGCQCIVGPG